MRCCLTNRLLIALLAWPMIGYAQPAVAPTKPDSPEGQFASAIRRASEAIAATPDDVHAYARRATLYSAAGQHLLAIADCDQSLTRDPQWADAYDLRGSEQFMLGRIDASIDDFDRAIKLRPDRERGHWKRGISYYYAGRYDEGTRQFEGYQSVDANDVENAVWRFLCIARSRGVETARDSLLKIKHDPRVPLMSVYSLFAGKLQSADVMQAANAGNPSPQELNTRLFYAHLYLGLHAEANGQRDVAAEQMRSAATHKINHYMWNVAEVHCQLFIQGKR